MAKIPEGNLDNRITSKEEPGSPLALFSIAV